MAGKKEDEILSGPVGDAMPDLSALTSTREGIQLKKALADIDPKKLLAAFSKLDKETMRAKLKGASAAELRKALQNKDLLDKLK